MSQLLPVAVTNADDLAPHLTRALAGGPAILPYAAGGQAPARLASQDVVEAPQDLALVVGTSGSTGSPKLAMLSAAALRASAEATHDVLGGAGAWLLTMPPQHIAGIQVLIRSLVGGHPVAAMDLRAGFTPEAFVAASTQVHGPHRYTALVPTQVSRLLRDPAATEALAAYDAVLVGGAGTPAPVADRALAAGVTLVPTYGMSETAGGCVYAGRPLPGAAVRIEQDRIHLGGATLATGYLGRPDLSAASFSVDATGTRWFRTDDAGHLDEQGRLRVDGRLDDLINTGGFKVAPRVVEDALLHCAGVSDALVVGVPDPEWGEAICAAVVGVGQDSTPTLESLREQLRDHLSAHAMPTRLRVVPQIPTRGPGKPDRRAVRRWFD